MNEKTQDKYAEHGLKIDELDKRSDSLDHRVTALEVDMRNLRQDNKELKEGQHRIEYSLTDIRTNLGINQAIKKAWYHNSMWIFAGVAAFFAVVGGNLLPISWIHFFHDILGWKSPS